MRETRITDDNPARAESQPGKAQIPQSKATPSDASFFHSAVRKTSLRQSPNPNAFSLLPATSSRRPRSRAAASRDKFVLKESQNKVILAGQLFDVEYYDNQSGQYQKYYGKDKFGNDLTQIYEYGSNISIAPLQNSQLDFVGWFGYNAQNVISNQKISFLRRSVV